MALSSKQIEYLQSCSHRWNIKVGATGSGKSWLDYAVVVPKRLLAPVSYTHLDVYKRQGSAGASAAAVRFSFGAQAVLEKQIKARARLPNAQAQ